MNKRRVSAFIMRRRTLQLASGLGSARPGSSAHPNLPTPSINFRVRESRIYTIEKMHQWQRKQIADLQRIKVVFKPSRTSLILTLSHTSTAISGNLPCFPAVSSHLILSIVVLQDIEQHVRLCVSLASPTSDLGI
jgi:hypothetical protein